MAKTLCIYHNDDDGFGAAWVIKRFYGAGEFVPAQYGQEPPDVRGKNVIIVDFSYKRPVMERLIEQVSPALLVAATIRKAADRAANANRYFMKPSSIRKK
jgi:oligoribonuclease NrnB/cAMP/cGMP phosphodiesterase (DHH superfamily)